MWLRLTGVQFNRVVRSRRRRRHDRIEVLQLRRPKRRNQGFGRCLREARRLCSAGPKRPRLGSGAQRARRVLARGRLEPWAASPAAARTASLVTPRREQPNTWGCRLRCTGLQLWPRRGASSARAVRTRVSHSARGRGKRKPVRSTPGGKEAGVPRLDCLSRVSRGCTVAYLGGLGCTLGRVGGHAVGPLGRRRTGPAGRCNH